MADEGARALLQGLLPRLLFYGALVSSVPSAAPAAVLMLVSVPTGVVKGSLFSLYEGFMRSVHNPAVAGALAGCCTSVDPPGPSIPHIPPRTFLRSAPCIRKVSGAIVPALQPSSRVLVPAQVVSCPQDLVKSRMQMQVLQAGRGDTLGARALLFELRRAVGQGRGAAGLYRQATPCASSHPQQTAQSTSSAAHSPTGARPKAHARV